MAGGRGARRVMAGAAAMTLAVVLASCGGSSDDGSVSSEAASVSASTDLMVDGMFEPMFDQTYALCAGAVAFVFDDVAYAKCQRLEGNSIADAHTYPGGDALSVNQLLTASGRAMVSTYSPPDPEDYALYECPAKGAFAQCNGGLCTAFEGEFPGLGEIASDEVVCSCPITYAERVYHVTGPAECPATQAGYDSVCGTGDRKDVTADGTILHIGAGGPPAATIDGLNRLYDEAFGTTTPIPPVFRGPGE